MIARRPLGILLGVLLGFPLCASRAAAAGSVELRIQGHAVFGQLQPVDVAEALVVPTLSVFAGKSGVVRMRAGVFAPILVLSSQRLGCGVVQQGLPPLTVLTKKGAAAMEARLATTRPKSTFAPVSFVPQNERDFAFQLVGPAPLDVADIKRIEQDTALRPEAFVALFGDARGAPPRIQFAVTQNSVWTPLLGGTTFHYDRSHFTLWREQGQLLAELDIKETALTARGTLPVEVCPPLLHLHIEPK